MELWSVAKTNEQWGGKSRGESAQKLSTWLNNLRTSTNGFDRVGRKAQNTEYGSGSEYIFEGYVD